MTTTCGIFLYTVDTKQILLVHPTHAPITQWSVPKGEMEEGDKPWKRALIELREETNIDLEYLSAFIHPLGTVVYEKNKQKQLTGFALLIRASYIIGNTLKCNSLVNGLFPEVDGFAWVDLRVAQKMMHESQRKLLPELEEIIKGKP
jgi:predicted NUDIX family NTP pyrophosphohydrolase